MPYLQLDVPFRIDAAVRADLAGRLSRLYAEVMATVPDVVTVAFRVLG
jgi:phenylpyruvate tautomerase PptA (4-oxalocrotonate tautomerase family)